MKRILLVFAIIVLLFASFCTVSAEAPRISTSSLTADKINKLILSTTPEERQEILSDLILYMILTDGPESIDMVFENLESASVEDSTSVEIRKSALSKNIIESKTPTYIEYPIIFEDYDFEAYITAWESCNFLGGDIGYEFSVTVYNNSGSDYEFGVKT